MKKEIVKANPLISKTFIVVLFATFTVISLVFFILKNSVIGAGFGYVEILFSLAFGIFITGFLLWCRSIMLRNPYLGLIIGIAGIIALIYGFRLQYTGPYSIGFLVLTSLIGIVYLGYNFLKYKDKEKFIPDEFDED